MEKTRKCPYCGEEIMADARKCRHCGEWLNDETEKKESENQPKNEVAEETKPDEVSQQEAIPNKSKVSLFRSCFWEQMTKHYCDFKGVVDRKTFWICFLYYILVMLVTSGISAIAPLLGTIVWLIVSLGLTLPWMGLYVRRLRDIGKKWVWIFFLLPGFFLSLVSKILPSSSGLVLAFLLVSLGGVVWFFVLMALRGKTQNPNKWNVKDTIITIVMLLVSIALFTMGLFVPDSDLSGKQGTLSENGQIIESMEISDESKKEQEFESMEIEKQILEAYNTGSIIDIMTSDYKAANEAVAEVEYLFGEVFYDSNTVFSLFSSQDEKQEDINVSEVNFIEKDKAYVSVWYTCLFNHEMVSRDSIVLLWCATKNLPILINLNGLLMMSFHSMTTTGRWSVIARKRR